MFEVGRGVFSRKTRVDEAFGLDILDLQRNGVFGKGHGSRWKVSWMQKEEIQAAISIQLEHDGGSPTGFRFRYSLEDPRTAQTEHFEYSVPIVSTPCYFGGERWWFRCPLSFDRESCNRRCRILYLPPGEDLFGCRECHRLTYKSRQRHRDNFYENFEKPNQEIETIKDKLARTRSWDKQLKLYRKFSHAADTIKAYADMIRKLKFL